MKAHEDSDIAKANQLKFEQEEFQKRVVISIGWLLATHSPSG